MITREQIEARLNQLKAEQAQLQEQIVQLQANLSAYQGAIQDCEYWLKEFNNTATGTVNESLPLTIEA